MDKIAAAEQIQLGSVVEIYLYGHGDCKVIVTGIELEMNDTEFLGVDIDTLDELRFTISNIQKVLDEKYKDLDTVFDYVKQIKRLRTEFSSLVTMNLICDKLANNRSR